MPCNCFTPLKTGDIAKIAGVEISFVRNWLSRELMTSAQRDTEKQWRRFSKIDALKFLTAIKISRDFMISASSAIYIANTVIHERTMDLHGYRDGQWIAVARHGDTYCWRTASSFLEAATGTMLSQFPITTRIVIPIGQILQEIESYSRAGADQAQENGENSNAP